MTVEHVEYEVILTTEADDPITVSIDEELVGRHTIETRRRIGAWRWPLMFKHRKNIRTLIDAADIVVDFGGAAGPIGYGAVIVDRIAEIRSLAELPAQPVDLIITSHTLEHIEDVWLCVATMFAKLKPGGMVVAVVPSYQDIHLRADQWPQHAHTFRLNRQNADCECTALDEVFERAGFEIMTVDAGFRNIIVFARKPTGEK